MSSNSFFLPLAPATSASYPQAPASRAATNVDGQSTTAAQPSRRRSSSSSSSTTSGHRILKLGPVHWGEHQDDHKEDFHEPTRA
ncbi:hypothetical protein QQS21_009100 [Conoideocrella luteorostrata]|uniref:Uncharacterized protein n=1 Tax=Conoideocrella luteorostrata TaxID=1105319 RepID=A0AAJ0CHK9_9HYPO|nr:hypothetical protein QQS21_009100 [Conoideocrella luteorostrata]